MRAQGLGEQIHRGGCLDPKDGGRGKSERIDACCIGRVIGIEGGAIDGLDERQGRAARRQGGGAIGNRCHEVPDRIADADTRIDSDLQERGKGDDGGTILADDAAVGGDLLIEGQAIRAGQIGKALSGLLRGRDQLPVQRGDLLLNRCAAGKVRKAVFAAAFPLIRELAMLM